VIHSFADETTADLFRERNTRAARRIPREIWRATQRKLKILDVAAGLDDLRVPAGNRLERLKGDQVGRYSVRINDQYRMTFRWEQGNAYEVRVEDYH
jgi:proteic killer suppression protein